jgi:protein-disulfide isomerase
VRSIVFWPPVKRIALVAALVVAVGVLGVFLLTPGGRAQVNLTVEPAMTKGAATAKVTIVEFSDYQ